MRKHILEDGIIVNTIEVDNNFQSSNMTLIDAEIGGSIGDLVTEGKVIPKATPVSRESILIQLTQLDLKSIRAIREGNQARIADLEAQAVELRAQLK